MNTTIETLYEVYPPQQGATVPLGIRVNDLVYGGGLDGAEPVTGALSIDVRQQMRVALGKLRALVEGAGGSLANVARATGFCTTDEHRVLIDEVWMDTFPGNDKPAFKQILAKLPPGHLVRLECQALLGEQRIRIDIPNVSAHDPTVRIGDRVFTSRCYGKDPESGDIVAGGLEAQTAQTLNNLVRLSELAGGSDADIVSMAMFGRDASYLPVARRVFQERFPDPAHRPALSQHVNVISERYEIAIEMSTGEMFQEIFLCPEHNSVPVGMRIGPVVFAAGISSVDPCSNELHGEGLEAQLRGAFDNVEAFLASAGCGLKDIVRVTVFMSDLTERHLLNGVWTERFPDQDDRPPHKYVPAMLPEGHLAMVQVMALVDAPPRRVIELDSVRHKDPMSMAALTGDLVTSARVVPGERPDGADEHTRLVFDNLAEIMERAGGSLADITQITAFIGEPRYRAAVEAELRRRLGDDGRMPELHTLEVDLGGSGGAPRIEILGLIKGDRDD